MLVVSKKDPIDFIGIREDHDLIMVWCPKCNKMLTNEYKRCPQCGKVFDDQWTEAFEEITKLETQEKKQQEMREFEDAIKTAYKIIEVAHKIGDKFIERTQFEFIAEMQMKLDKEGKQDELKARAIQISKEFDILVKEKKIIQAHSSVLNLKKEFDEYKNLFFSIQEVRELNSKDDAIMSLFLAEQDKIVKDLEKIEKQIEEDAKKNEFNSADERWVKARELLSLCQAENLKRKWRDLWQDYQRKKGIYEEGKDLIKKVNKSIEQASELALKFQFDEALTMLNSVINLIKKKNESNNLSEHIEKLTKKREEINSKQQLCIEKLEKLKKYEDQFNENYSKNYLHVALNYCRIIIENAFLISKKDLAEKYKTLSIEIQKSLDKQKTDEDKEREDLLTKAKELGEMIQTEEDVLPIIEDFSISEIVGDLSSDDNRILEQVSSLLQEHRVEVKNKILTQTTLHSATEDIVELKEIKEVEEIKMEEKGVLKEPIEYKARSGFMNPSDYVIEKGILTDLIPYNFQIIKMQLNGKEPIVLPEKTLNKDGLELKWNFEKIHANEGVEISYDLRQRVSRTIILMHKDRLKIIKYHSKLKPTEIEDMYEVNLPFINTYSAPLRNTVIEDIMPLYYIHSIIVPKNIFPTKITSSNQGTVLKWDLATIDKGWHPYIYKLFEMFRYLQLKVRFEMTTKRGIEALTEGKIEESFKVYQDIAEILKVILK